MLHRFRKTITCPKLAPLIPLTCKTYLPMDHYFVSYAAWGLPARSEKGKNWACNENSTAAGAFYSLHQKLISFHRVMRPYLCACTLKDSLPPKLLRSSFMCVSSNICSSYSELMNSIALFFIFSNTTYPP